MISIRIMALRMRNSMTQAQLAKVLNISPSTLGMYEQGRRTPGIDALVRLSHCFHVSLDYLITGSEFPHRNQADSPRTPDRRPCNTCFWKEYSK